MTRKVFITGATGYLGGAIAARVARAGYGVYGLTRSAAHAGALTAAGVRPVIGDLARPETYVSTLKNCDAAIHAAIDPTQPALMDQAALAALHDAAEDGRVRRVLYTSTIWAYGDSSAEVADESTPLNPAQLIKWRAAHEEVALDLVDHEVDVVVFRPGVVYGESRGIVGAMFAMARDRREVLYPGDGAQSWSLVHRDDVAEAYRLALEYASGGERYVLVDESPLAARAIAEAVARVTGATARAWDAPEVVKSLGGLGQALLYSHRASSAKARRELGWVPRHTSFANEIDSLLGEWQSGQQTPVG
jgi:nucleoside-diphosphate-sugar epimerase